jgi:hypothetical protein
VVGSVVVVLCRVLHVLCLLGLGRVEVACVAGLLRALVLLLFFLSLLLFTMLVTLDSSILLQILPSVVFSSR